MATAEEIATAAATNAASGVSSHAGDGTQTTALDPVKQLDVADRLQNKSNATGTTRGLIFTKLSSPGAV